MNAIEPIDVYEVSTNSDLTEGRGDVIHLAYCELRTTALRLAKGKGVQGTDAYVNIVRLYRIGERVYGPVRLAITTPADRRAEDEQKQKNELLAKIRAAGITDDELKQLGVLP